MASKMGQKREMLPRLERREEVTKEKKEKKKTSMEHPPYAQ
jgi:hypothetical protein